MPFAIDSTVVTSPRRPCSPGDEVGQSTECQFPKASWVDWEVLALGRCSLLITALADAAGGHEIVGCEKSICRVYSEYSNTHDDRRLLISTISLIDN